MWMKSRFTLYCLEGSRSFKDYFGYSGAQTVSFGAQNRNQSKTHQKPLSPNDCKNISSCENTSPRKCLPTAAALSTSEQQAHHWPLPQSGEEATAEHVYLTLDDDVHSVPCFLLTSARRAISYPCIPSVTSVTFPKLGEWHHVCPIRYTVLSSGNNKELIKVK
jgi:hypothetical protein